MSPVINKKFYLKKELVRENKSENIERVISSELMDYYEVFEQAKIAYKSELEIYGIYLTDEDIPSLSSIEANNSSTKEDNDR